MEKCEYIHNKWQNRTWFSGAFYLKTQLHNCKTGYFFTKNQGTKNGEELLSNASLIVL